MVKLSVNRAVVYWIKADLIILLLFFLYLLLLLLLLLV